MRHYTRHDGAAVRIPMKAAEGLGRAIGPLLQIIPPVQRPALKRAAIPAADFIPEEGGGAPLFWYTPSFIQPRARFRVARGPPVPARRERSARTDLGPVDGD